MLLFLARRLLSLVFVLFSITFLTFIVGYLAPGDPIQSMMGSRRDPATYERLKHEYGLDRPWLEQYGSYITGVLRGDLGKSFRYAGRPVWDLIKTGIGVSAALGMAALIFSLLIGLPIGVIAAARAGGAFDRISMITMLVIFHTQLRARRRGANRAGWPVQGRPAFAAHIGLGRIEVLGVAGARACGGFHWLYGPVDPQLRA